MLSMARILGVQHELFVAAGLDVYLCDPPSPWQRGTCENTNGPLRQYLPKGSSLSIYSQDELDAIADSLNSRLLATPAFHSPFEVFAATLVSASLPRSTKHLTPRCTSPLKSPRSHHPMTQNPRLTAQIVGQTHPHDTRRSKLRRLTLGGYAKPPAARPATAVRTFCVFQI